MPVTVDRQPLAAEELGMQTVGQLLNHLQQDDRLVTRLLIDGEEPQRLAAARQIPLRGHTLYIETADPRALAMEVLDGVSAQLDEADRLKDQAADLLLKSQTVKAMEKLSGCLSTWHHAQESVQKTAQLLRLDLQQVTVDGAPLIDMLAEFADQLRQVRSTLEQRDFVSLGDILQYEMTESSARWRAAIESLRQAVQSIGA